MTDLEFLAWLDSPAAIRVVLVEVGVLVGNVETTRLLADRPYSTEAGVPYLPIVRGGISFDESLPLDGQPSLSTGSIEIDNASGERDSWLVDVWRNRGIEVFIGDVRWPRAAFRRIFAGTVHDIGARDASVLNLALRDKLQRLNTPASEATLGGTGVNKDALLPLLFGEVFNVSPLLADDAVHEYQVHAGPIERVIEVRDNGVPVATTPTLATGKFRLAKSPAGQITASIQGDKAGTYRNTVGAMRALLAANARGDAAALAHKLAGVAGSLALPATLQAAQQAEQLLHAGDDASAALDALEQALAHAIDAVAAFTAQTPAPGQPAMPETQHGGTCQ